VIGCNLAEVKRSQHYDWMVPLYYRTPGVGSDSDFQVLYLQARTTTVKRTIVPSVEMLEFGEIPVAFRKVNNAMSNECYRPRKFCLRTSELEKRSSEWRP
jgi:hypothetical protein